MYTLYQTIKPEFCGSIYRVASTAAASAFTGASINRTGFYGAQISVPYTTVLTSGKTLSLKLTYQDSADNSSWGGAVTITDTTVVATGDPGGSTETGVWDKYLDLKPVKKYVRFNLTATLNATASDTVTTAAVAILGESDNLPV